MAPANEHADCAAEMSGCTRGRGRSVHGYRFGWQSRDVPAVCGATP